jgi:hypothetical protein
MEVVKKNKKKKKLYKDIWINFRIQNVEDSIANAFHNSLSLSLSRKYQMDLPKSLPPCVLMCVASKATAHDWPTPRQFRTSELYHSPVGFYEAKAVRQNM